MHAGGMFREAARHTTRGVAESTKDALIYAGTELPGYPPLSEKNITGCPHKEETVNSQVAPCNTVPSGWPLCQCSGRLCEMSQSWRWCGGSLIPCHGQMGSPFGRQLPGLCVGCFSGNGEDNEWIIHLNHVSTIAEPLSGYNVMLQRQTHESGGMQHRHGPPTF